MTVRDLPTVNACLNAASAFLLVLGWTFIRRRKIDAHRRTMTAAFLCSALFLVSYLAYHAQVGSVRFPGTGGARALYLGILLTHTVLAAAVAPLAITTFVLARRGRFDRHRKLARFTLPIWLYVSVTGVVVYVMLYRMRWPPPGAGPAPAKAASGVLGGVLSRLSSTTFHALPVVDRQQGGLAVGILAVPDGWTAASNVRWNYADSSWPFQWSSRIAAPDGSAWLEIFPAECFYWLEPADRSTRVGAKSLGMIHRPGIGAKDAMTWLIARHRGGARNFHVVGFRPIPNLAAALGKPAFPGDSVAARVRYEKDGHPVDEEFFLVLGANRIPYHGPQGTSYENHRILAYAHSMGARDGRLDTLHPLLGFVVSSFRPDPVWEQRRVEVQGRLNEQFNRNLAAGYSRIAAAGALSRQISANNDRMISTMDAQRASRNAAMDRVNDNFSQYIRGTERMQDPYWGTSEHAYTEKYHWTDGQGNYRHSNDAGFDPNVGGTGNWQLMQPAK